jgi:hypothetical protein
MSNEWGGKPAVHHARSFTVIGEPESWNYVEGNPPNSTITRPAWAVRDARLRQNTTVTGRETAQEQKLRVNMRALFNLLFNGVEDRVE